MSGAVEYVSTFTDSGGNNHYPAPAQVVAQTVPGAYDISAYRPGGAEATAAQLAGKYHVVTGTFQVSASNTVLDGLYYVTGDVKLGGSNLRGKVTIVAEGTIDSSGSAQRFTAYAGNLVFFANQTNPSKAAITLSGSKSTLVGILYAPGGAIVLPGSSNTVFGSLVGTAVTLNGSSLVITCSGLPKEDQEPPPAIVIHESDIVREIEHVNGVIFVNISITIVNTGGAARGVFLVLNRAEFAELFDLADVSFLESIGYVSSVDADHVMIGLGQNNKIHHNEKVKIKLKFKRRAQITVDITFNTRFSLIFGGTGGTRTLALPPIVVIVPVVVPGTTPVGGTPVITPTTGITPTIGITPTVIVVPRLPLSVINIRIVGFWRSRGGTDIFGLPISQPITLPSGIVVQYFERARLEFHPEHRGTQYAVLLGLLGVELGYSAPETATTAPTATAELVWYFPATRHLVAQPFRAYWKNRGGLLIFGLPIGEAHLEDGRLCNTSSARASSCTLSWSARRMTSSSAIWACWRSRRTANRKPSIAGGGCALANAAPTVCGDRRPTGLRRR